MPKYKIVASSVYSDYMQTEHAGMRRRFFWVSGKWNPFSLGHRVATELLPQFHCNFYGESVYNCLWEMWKGWLTLEWQVECSFWHSFSFTYPQNGHPYFWRELLGCWLPVESVCIICLHSFYFCGVCIAVFVKRDWARRDSRRHNWESFSVDIWTII